MEGRNSRETRALPGDQRAPRPSQMMGSRRTAMRVMHRKSSGIVAVYEQDPTANSAGTRTLVFETPTSCTRLTQFPAEWHRLSDDELASLRRKAS